MSCPFLEGDCPVQSRLPGAGAESPQLDVVNEGDVVSGVPVQAVAVQVEWHRVQHGVDGGHHLQHEVVTRSGLTFHSHPPRPPVLDSF